MYGNYDGLNKAPVFDLHLGVNYWTTVNTSDAGTSVIVEVIAVVPGYSAQVCLVNTGSGTPFISSLDLRPLKNSLYPMADATQGLVLVSRANFGPTDVTKYLRFPDDPYDRIWWPRSNPTEWSNITTQFKMQNFDNENFEAPSAVMQTAVTPINASRPIEFSWDVGSLLPVSAPSGNHPEPGYIFIVYLSELQVLQPGSSRRFNVTINGIPYTSSDGFTSKYLYTNALYKSEAQYGFHLFNASLDMTPDSTLPPLLNGLEIFSVVPTTVVPTAAQYLSAITAIRGMYQVKKNWMGDPCVPKNFSWTGLGCSYNVSIPPSVTGLNLSSSGLSGNLSSSFASLGGLEYLDLSRNNLTGTIPDTFSQLSLLALLDLTDNQLSGSIPSGLLERMQDGSLTLRYSKNPNLCTNSDSCQPPKKKKSSKVAVYVAVPIVAALAIVLLSVLLICMLRRKQGTTTRNSVRPQNEARIALWHSRGSIGHSSVRLNNRRFTYAVRRAGDGFRRMIGRGGFGKVYDGFLECGTQVAVKLRSESSDQGVQEFLAEAETLAKIHHKNLVSLIGYCKDKEYMVLVYEYMSEGALHEHLRGMQFPHVTKVSGHEQHK